MKYAIWNKIDEIITPSGHVFTAEQWMDKYPVAKLNRIDVVCSAGEINGAVFGTLGQLVEQYEQYGCDFSACATAEEKIAVINEFEQHRGAATQAVEEDPVADSLASIAASLEYQNMMTLEDIEA